MLHAKLLGNQTIGFYYIWSRPYRSSVPDAADKRLFSLPKEAPHKNRL